MVYENKEKSVEKEPSISARRKRNTEKARKETLPKNGNETPPPRGIRQEVRQESCKKVVKKEKTPRSRSVTQSNLTN